MDHSNHKISEILNNCKIHFNLRIYHNNVALKCYIINGLNADEYYLQVLCSDVESLEDSYNSPKTHEDFLSSISQGNSSALGIPGIGEGGSQGEISPFLYIQVRINGKNFFIRSQSYSLWKMKRNKI